MKVRYSTALCMLGLLADLSAHATPLAINDIPLPVSAQVPPLNMIVLGRDHKLYYEAYNDASDLNGDDKLDTKYFPQHEYQIDAVTKQPVIDPKTGDPVIKRKGIDYYGYFDPYKCYTYTNNRFEPVATTADKRCTGTDPITKKSIADDTWSGDFLNYVTTSRIDAIRKVLYGGYRSTDTATETVLERSRIPQDAHSWGKEYKSTADDGYNIADYTPLKQPAAGTRHLFANTTLLSTTTPLLRVLTDQGAENYLGQNVPVRIWHWLSIERPVAGPRFFDGREPKDGGNGVLTRTPTDYYVRVKVCVAGMVEENCTKYGNNYKPTGLLQEYGNNNTMLFGLLTGSYNNNLEGGVLRKKISSIGDEINPTTGEFKTDAKGIIKTLNELKVVDFGAGYTYSCGWDYASKQLENGKCRMWGNPLAEMMYESVRYFAGKKGPTSSYVAGISDGSDGGLSLPLASWDNPYDLDVNKDGRRWCSKPFMTLISDLNQSFDSDVPGGAFGSPIGNSLTGFDPQLQSQAIWDREFGIKAKKNVFVGELQGVDVDRNPTPKPISSLGSIRGLAPEEPTRQGSYYSAAVAAYARTNDVNPAQGKQQIQTFSIALASPLPRIQVPLRNGKKITVIPFAKSVGGYGVETDKNKFQPTNQIVDFYVQEIVNDVIDTDKSVNGGDYRAVFQINYEDVENGGDHDMDAIARYTITANDKSEVSVKVDSLYANGSIAQHMGYVISGSDTDGPYLVIRDCDTANGVAGGTCSNTGTNPNKDPDYYLDTPNTANVPLPLTSTRTFTATGASASGEFIKPPMWFAAKYGGYRGEDSFAGLPDLNATEDAKKRWDEDGDKTPDNYFLVVNPLKLKDQLRKAFDDILRRTTSTAGVAASSSSLRSDTHLYIAKFSSSRWDGSLLAYKIKSDGSIGDLAWDAADHLKTSADSVGRKIFTTKRGTAVTPVGVEFAWNKLGDTQLADLNRNPSTGNDDGLGLDRLKYLRGDRSLEEGAKAPFRQRGTSTLGDIVYSSPKYVSKPSDAHEDEDYKIFRKDNEDRKSVVYVGANDGMLHAFDAANGEELFGYIPSIVIPELNKLTYKNYSHQYYVDGSPTVKDVKLDAQGWRTALVGGLNKGGKAVYALDVTRPESMSATNVMWEFTNADDVDLGFTYSQPKLVKLNNGKWAAVFGNGYNSKDEKAALYILYMDGPGTGGKWDLGATKDYIKIDTGWTSGSNGLSGVTPIDIDADGKVDYVYAGDLRGNLWKFDLTASDASNWKLAFGSNKPLFTATDGSNTVQPITAEPVVSLHPAYYSRVGVSSSPTPAGGSKLRGTVVYFGTGKYLELCDITSACSAHTNKQSFYGIWDDNRAITTKDRSELMRQEFSDTDTHELKDDPIDWKKYGGNGKMGWFIDLTETERVVSSAYLISGKVLFNTILPSKEPCEPGGDSWLMCSKYQNGGKCEGFTGIKFDDRLVLGPPALINRPGSGEMRRIDEDLSSNSTATSNYGTDKDGNPVATAMPDNLDNMRLRLVNWRELINE